MKRLRMIISIGLLMTPTIAFSQGQSTPGGGVKDSEQVVSTNYCLEQLQLAELIEESILIQYNIKKINTKKFLKLLQQIDLELSLKAVNTISEKLNSPQTTCLCQEKRNNFKSLLSIYEEVQKNNHNKFKQSCSQFDKRVKHIEALKRIIEALE